MEMLLVGLLTVSGASIVFLGAVTICSRNAERRAQERLLEVLAAVSFATVELKHAEAPLFLAHWHSGSTSAIDREWPEWPGFRRDFIWSRQ